MPFLEEEVKKTTENRKATKEGWEVGSK